MRRNRGSGTGRSTARRLARAPVARTHWLAATAGVVGLVALGACGGDREGAVPLRTVPPTSAAPAPTTMAKPTTETTRVRVTTTVAPRVTTTVPPRPPVLVDGVPQVTATPARAGVGARVHVEGYGFTDQQWRSPSTLWLTASPTVCNIYAEAEHSVRVSGDGHLSGDFVVPATGECRMSDVGGVAVTPGTYTIAYACTACFVGTFTVT
jgi:hypothetical protein